MQSSIIDLISNSIGRSFFLLGSAGVLCLTAVFLLNKIQSERTAALLACVLMVAIVIYIYRNHYIAGSTFMRQAVLAVIVTANIYLPGVLKLRKRHIPIVFSGIFLICFSFANIRLSFWTVYLFVILCIILRTEGKRIEESVFGIWISVLAGSLNYLIYDFIVFGYLYEFYSWIIRAYQVDSIGKIIIWTVILILYLSVNIAAILLFRRLCRALLSDLYLLSTKYREFGSEYTVISIVMLVCVYIFSMLVSIPGSVLVYEDEKIIMLYGFDGMVLVIQILYLVLLIKLGKTKMQKADSDQEKQNLILYNSSLEQNMQEIRNIKHDIKNIFFTMSEYVNRNDDAEMKAFFKEKIIPFASEEIYKNDIYMKLQQIPAEEFRAFLYYKINQALAYGIETEIEIKLEEAPFKMGIPLTDLVRILGIFFDNAIEEAVQAKEKYLRFKLTSTAEVMGYLIENAVREQVKQSGVVSGTTTKGLGRGNGLLIVDDILKKYDNSVRNSYFKDSHFIQNLLLYKDI